LLPLGWGVSAQVFKICWADGTHGVLKDFKIKSSANPDKVLQTINHELEILCRLNHPNVIAPVGLTGTGELQRFFTL
jgi:hypothetical protein